ncbi:unnamed protein product [Amoebophrya sp. A120]|nr:unnamed protein product [Amoebophrya sp. A120]|eukprot:GSA120T00020156001.1
MSKSKTSSPSDPDYPRPLLADRRTQVPQLGVLKPSPEFQNQLEKALRRFSKPEFAQRVDQAVSSFQHGAAGATRSQYFPSTSSRSVMVDHPASQRKQHYGGAGAYVEQHGNRSTKSFYPAGYPPASHMQQGGPSSTRVATLVRDLRGHHAAAASSSNLSTTSIVPGGAGTSGIGSMDHIAQQHSVGAAIDLSNLDLSLLRSPGGTGVVARGQQQDEHLQLMLGQEEQNGLLVASRTVQQPRGLKRVPSTGSVNSRTSSSYAGVGRRTRKEEQSYGVPSGHDPRSSRKTSDLFDYHPEAPFHDTDVVHPEQYFPNQFAVAGARTSVAGRPQNRSTRAGGANNPHAGYLRSTYNASSKSAVKTPNSSRSTSNWSTNLSSFHQHRVPLNKAGKNRRRMSAGTAKRSNALLSASGLSHGGAEVENKSKRKQRGREGNYDIKQELEHQAVDDGSEPPGSPSVIIPAGEHEDLLNLLPDDEEDSDDEDLLALDVFDDHYSSRAGAGAGSSDHFLSLDEAALSAAANISGAHNKSRLSAYSRSYSGHDLLNLDFGSEHLLPFSNASEASTSRSRISPRKKLRMLEINNRKLDELNLEYQRKILQLEKEKLVLSRRESTCTASILGGEEDACTKKPCETDDVGDTLVPGIGNEEKNQDVGSTSAVSAVIPGQSNAVPTTSSMKTVARASSSSAAQFLDLPHVDLPTPAIDFHVAPLHLPEVVKDQSSSSTRATGAPASSSSSSSTTISTAPATRVTDKLFAEFEQFMSSKAQSGAEPAAESKGEAAAAAAAAPDEPKDRSKAQGAPGAAGAGEPPAPPDEVNTTILLPESHTTADAGAANTTAAATPHPGTDVALPARTSPATTVAMPADQESTTTSVPKKEEATATGAPPAPAGQSQQKSSTNQELLARRLQFVESELDKKSDECLQQTTKLQHIELAMRQETEHFEKRVAKFDLQVKQVQSHYELQLEEARTQILEKESQLALLASKKDEEISQAKHEKEIAIADLNRDWRMKFELQETKLEAIKREHEEKKRQSDARVAELAAKMEEVRTDATARDKKIRLKELHLVQREANLALQERRKATLTENGAAGRVAATCTATTVSAGVAPYAYQHAGFYNNSIDAKSRSGSATPGAAGVSPLWQKVS